MLKQLLKYEFKATKRLYFGLYLALALLSVVLGVSFRQENARVDNTNFGRLEVILMVLYLSVIFAIAVLCFVSTVQRFYKNLLGREGYLMHTLPVTETQLILSKLITSMVWVLCSGLVGIVCITVMVSIGVFDPCTLPSTPPAHIRSPPPLTQGRQGVVVGCSLRTTLQGGKGAVGGCALPRHSSPAGLGSPV